MLRKFLLKKEHVITKDDITAIRNFMNESITNWPWTPRHIIKISNTGDLEFAARSPELVNKLCEYIFYLYSLIEDLENVSGSDSE